MQIQGTDRPISRPPRVRAWAWALGAGAVLATAASACAQTPPRPDRPYAKTCNELALAEWPRLRGDRQRLLRELDAHTERCANTAAFLALLGALWLEDGQAAQALIWLERAMLLDPHALGARADHALALAALGEPAARDELLAAWQFRNDVPPALMQRLRAERPLGTVAINNGSNGGRWMQRGEFNLRLGHDTNLDRSPVLDGITLTSPDGPIDLPLAIPLRPRPGDASWLDLGWRVAYDSGSGALWQFGVAAAARRAPSESQTDWQYLQLRADHWRAHGPWRSQIQLGGGRSSGPLNEPYNVFRLGVALERDLADCTHRASFEAETRRQAVSSYLDGNLYGGLISSQCLVPGLKGWRAGAELRGSTDRPQAADRPGGRQQQWGLTLKISGEFGPFTLDTHVSVVQAKDADGFSPLLENNARRNFRQRLFNAELGYRLPGQWVGKPEAFLQWSDARQTSNISLFVNSGSSVYAGTRWRW